MSASSFMDAVVLLGDSITEAFTAGSFSQRMAEYYIRKLDVINRGYGGYNTEWIQPVAKRAFATKEAQGNGQAQRIRLITIWLGANDAVLEGENQHVPLASYRDNLSKLINLIKDPSSAHHSPDTKILLMTPTPIISDKWERNLAQRRAEQGEPASDKPTRTLAFTKQYVDACIETARKEGVSVLDAYTTMIEAAGGDDAASLDAYLYDGLHLTPLGYEVITTKVIEIIEQQMPDVAATKMLTRAPIWSDVAADPAILQKTLGQ